MLVNTKIGKRKNRAAEAIQNPLAFFRSVQNITWTVICCYINIKPTVHIFKIEISQFKLQK